MKKLVSNSLSYLSQQFPSVHKFEAVGQWCHAFAGSGSKHKSLPPSPNFKLQVIAANGTIMLLKEYACFYRCAVDDGILDCALAFALAL